MKLSMTEFSALQEKLTRLATTPGFLLDDRTVQQRLTFLQQYTSHIPFDTDIYWDSLLFPAEWSVERLADIYQQPEIAAGNLPPLQAFILSFLRLQETPVALLNWFPAAHRELYYRHQLGLTERRAEPARVALSMQLNPNTAELMVPAGLRFSAGQDSQGAPVYYRLDESILACQARLSDLYWVYQNQTDQRWYKHTVCDKDHTLSLPPEGVALLNTIIGGGTDLPADTNQTHSNIYLGFTGITPGQTLSLFWQLKSPVAFKLQWQYQCQDKGLPSTWQNLNTLSRDDTQGFLGSGLWQAVLPENSVADIDKRYWLRVSLQSDETAYPQLQGLLINAMTATLDDVDKRDPSQPLPVLEAGTIQQPESRVVGLSGVQQPFASFNGQDAEQSEAFFARVAQRLSHRNRALSWNDMALLLKTQFASIFDVITPSVATLTTIPASTTQKLVVLPRPESRDNGDLLRPIFSAYHLKEMQDWLSLHTSCWQNIVVDNPSYKLVKVGLKVVWHQGINPDYALGLLHQRLTRHYMPWSQPDGGELVTGGLLDYYDIIARIQDDPNVSRVDSLSLDDTFESVYGADNEVLILNFL